jgi:hypothetical protein
MSIWMTGHDVDLKALIVFSGRSCVWGKEPCIRSVLELLWNCCKMCPCVLLPWFKWYLGFSQTVLILMLSVPSFSLQAHLI